MRDLTPAEYRTVLSILSHPGATERHRIRLSRLPTSTYNVVRRRVFEEGWLTDVLIPNPGPCGFSGVEFLLERPSVAERGALVQEWTKDPECVLLWSGVHVVFGVFFRPAPESPSATSSGIAHDRGLFRVRTGSSSGSVPVYFDYSGPWARFGREPPPAGYPVGLELSARTASPRALAEARRWIRSDGESIPRSGRWTNLVSLTRGHPQALDQGVVQPRTLLHQAKVPPFDGRRIGEVIFIVGRLRPASTAAFLLNSLTHECEVYPFLLAEARGQVLLAGLGQTSAKDAGRVLVPSAARPVMSVVDRHLDPADVLIEPVEAIEEVVHHKYPDRFPGVPSRLAAPTTARGR